MKLIKGVYFPDSDTHFEKMMDDEGNYQKEQFDTALKYIKLEDRGLFIDVGAHVGLWSRMAQKAGFKEILAIEPDIKNYECLDINLDNCFLSRLALSDERTSGRLVIEKVDNSGANHLVEGEDFPVEPFDRYFSFIKDEFDLSKQTLTKIDVQGYEAKVIRGMTNFIKEYKPIIIVEQWLNGKEDLEATKYCESLGMKILETIKKEVILGW
jgi:FkbM family methyltransferase